jgi:hypothetical protein
MRPSSICTTMVRLHLSTLCEVFTKFTEYIQNMRPPQHLWLCIH